MSEWFCSRGYAPPLGDLRNASAGDYIAVFSGVADRPDWPKIWDALGVAYARGADIEFRES